MLTLLAQQTKNIGDIFKGFGPLGLENLQPGEDISHGTIMPKFVGILSNVLGIMTIVAGLWFIFQFIIGGLGFMIAGGDPKKMETARAKITSALIGLIIVVAAYAIIHLIGALLGLDILNIQNVIQYLGPGGVG